MLQASTEDSYTRIAVEDDSNIVFSNRVSTLKIYVENHSPHPLKSIYVCPPESIRDKKRVRGLINSLQVIWGGGFTKGCRVMLPGDRDTLAPGSRGVAYFLLYHPSLSSGSLRLPLEVYVGDRLVHTFNVSLQLYSRDIRGYVYRPRYCPRINTQLLGLVKDVISDYGIPSIEIYVWRSLPTPKVQIIFEGNEIAVIKGDIGSGFTHIFKINMHQDLFVGLAPDPLSGVKKWYWVTRIWFFWLDKSVFDEVPDAERIELWVNPDTRKVDWLITDKHWKEVAYRGPVEKAKVKIPGPTRPFRLNDLGKFIRSYHPPIVLNMEEYMISQDSRDPLAQARTIYD